MNIVKDIEKNRPALAKNAANIIVGSNVAEALARKNDTQLGNPEKLHAFIDILQGTGAAAKAPVYTDMAVYKLTSVLPEQLKGMMGEIESKPGQKAEIINRYSGNSAKRDASAKLVTETLNYVADNGYIETKIGKDFSQKMIDETLASVGIKSKHFKSGELDKGALEGSTLKVSRDTISANRKAALVASFKDHETAPNLSKAVVAGLMNGAISLPEYMQFAASMKDLPYKQGLEQDKGYKGEYKKYLSTYDGTTMRIFYNEAKPDSSIVVIPMSRLGSHPEKQHDTFKAFLNDVNPETSKLVEEQDHKDSYILELSKLKEMYKRISSDKDASEHKFIMRVVQGMEATIDPKLQVSKEAEQRSFSELGYFMRLANALAQGEHFDTPGDKTKIAEVRLADIVLQQSARDSKKLIKKNDNSLVELGKLVKKIEGSFTGKANAEVLEEKKASKTDVLEFNDAKKVDAFAGELAGKFPSKMANVISMRAEKNVGEANVNDVNAGKEKVGAKDTGENITEVYASGDKKKPGAKRKKKEDPDMTAGRGGSVRAQNAELASFFTNQHFARTAVEVYNSMMGREKAK